MRDNYTLSLKVLGKRSNGSCDIDVNGKDEDAYTALIWASDAGYTDIVKQLLDHPDIQVNHSDSDGHTALTWASDKGRIESINLLLTIPSIDPNCQAEDENEYTPLICAAASGYHQVVGSLLQCPTIDVNMTTGTGSSALIYSSEKGHTEVVRLLVRHNLFPNTLI